MRPISKLIAFTILAVPALSVASPVTITFDQVDMGNAYNLTFDHKTEDVFVGSLLFSSKAVPSPFVTFCVDLQHFISNGQSYSVNPVFTDSLPSSSAYRLAGDILDAGIGTATDNNHAAALQLAIWKSVYGNKFSVSGVSSTVLGEESSYFNAGKNFNGNAIYLQGARGCKGQSQITTTPEPTSLAVLGVGAFGVFFKRKKA